MNVRCKFKVQEKTDIANYGSSKGKQLSRVTLIPVSGNEAWSKWTPSGKIELTISNPAAVDALELGEEYYVDFTKADS